MVRAMIRGKCILGCEGVTRICWWKVKRWRTYVPVFPDRARELCIISREVPKSDSMARGLKSKT